MGMFSTLILPPVSPNKTMPRTPRTTAIRHPSIVRAMKRRQRPARTGASSDTDCPSFESDDSNVFCCDSSVRGCRTQLRLLSLDRLHIGVRQPKMVADFVDQDV